MSIILKKILLIANTSWYLYNFRSDLIVELLKKKYEVYCIVPKDKYFENLKKIGVKTYPIIIDRGGISILNDMKYMYSLLKEIKKIKPEIIHHFTIKPVIYGSLITKLFFPKIKIINSIPGKGTTFLKKSFLKKFATILYKISLSNRHQVIFQNPNDMNSFISDKIVTKFQSNLILSSGVNLDKFKPTNKINDQSLLKIGIASRMLWTKGIGEFVQAGKRILKNYNNVEFYILGSPDNKNPDNIPENWLQEVNELDGFYWQSHVDDIKSFLLNFHIFVLPTYYPEGVPKSLIEAAAMEIPIITTDTPGCREVVENGKNGLLIDKKNVENLIEAIQYLIENENIRKKMGKEGRKLAIRNFNVINVNRDTIKLYEM